MTCVVGISMPGIVVLAADTRANLQAKGSADFARRDTSFAVDLTDGTELRVPASYVKLRPTRFGWCAYSGDLLMGAYCADALAGIHDRRAFNVPELVRSTFRARAPMISRFLNCTEQAVAASRFFAAQAVGPNLRLSAVDMDGRDTVPPGSNYFVSAPPELRKDIEREITAEFEAALVRASQTLDGLLIYRGIVTFMDRVHRAAPSVSGTTEIGIVCATPQDPPQRAYVRARVGDVIKMPMLIPLAQIPPVTPLIVNAGRAEKHDSARVDPKAKPGCG